MSALSYVLGGVVLLYTIAYAVKMTTPIIRYMRCNKGGELQVVEGSVIEKVAEENKAFQGIMVNISLPKYEFEISGIKKQFLSTVRYRNAIIGQVVSVGYCERTGEAWAINDIPVMKKETIMRIAVMLAILAVLMLTEILL